MEDHPPEHVSSSLSGLAFTAILLKLPHPTAGLQVAYLNHRVGRRSSGGITLDPRHLPVPAAQHVQAQGGTFPQELLLACAPHLVQVDRSFALPEAPSHQSAATGEEGRPTFSFQCSLQSWLLMLPHDKAWEGQLLASNV